MASQEHIARAKTFGVNLFNAMKLVNVGVEELATRCQRQNAQIQDYIDGRHLPTMKTVEMLANHLSTTSKVLLGGTTTYPSANNSPSLVSLQSARDEAKLELLKHLDDCNAELLAAIETFEQAVRKHERARANHDESLFIASVLT